MACIYRGDPNHLLNGMILQVVLDPPNSLPTTHQFLGAFDVSLRERLIIKMMIALKNGSCTLEFIGGLHKFMFHDLGFATDVSFHEEYPLVN